MKQILATFLLFVGAQAYFRFHPGRGHGHQQSSYPPYGVANGHHPFNGHFGQSQWYPPQYQYQQESHQQRQYFYHVNADEATWVCRNTKSGDMVFITTEEEIKSENGPQWKPIPTKPPIAPEWGYQPGGLITVVEKKPTERPPNDYNGKEEVMNEDETSEPPVHHGEGMIDIRIGGS